MAVFEKHLTGVEKNAQKEAHDPDCSPEGLIWACLFGEGLEDIDWYDCCTYFQSITKSVQSFLAATFETF